MCKDHVTRLTEAACGGGGPPAPWMFIDACMGLITRHIILAKVQVNQELKLKENVIY